ncbi:MAG: hypothetical protein ACOX2L_05985 [Anaerolineae bacterium]|jgi:hypothetical protein|nr:hypothetical protein [Chloroflexota bacterium]
MRTERLGIVLTPREKSAILMLAELEGGLSQSGLVRRLVRQAATARGVWSSPDKEQTKEQEGEQVHV